MTAAIAYTQMTAMGQWQEDCNKSDNNIQRLVVNWYKLQSQINDDSS